MTLKARSRLGKYRIQKRLAEGGFATVYRAHDTIEGISVALKVPHRVHMTDEMMEAVRQEIRISARLQHPNILHLKNADKIDGHLVLAYPLGDETLHDRMKRRISTTRALDYAEQMLEALAHAHHHRIIHCDVKPENFIIFDDDLIRLTDFGIAKITMHTLLSASGSGTVGYVAPEQAMGRPSFRSDCFSMGLVLYRMLAGQLPRWPYEWPPPGHELLRRKVSLPFVRFIRRAIAVRERERFANAEQMLRAFEKVRIKATSRKPRRKPTRTKTDGRWREERTREFRRRFGKALAAKYECSRCRGPVGETMLHCPWCAQPRKKHRQETPMPHECKRCGRGMKLDWTYCAWCYGAAQGPQSERAYPDKKYAADCSKCRGPLLPFSRYCPWCRGKVRRKWKIEGSRDRCRGCGWSTLGEYWSCCPWCGRKTTSRQTT